MDHKNEIFMREIDCWINANKSSFLRDLDRIVAIPSISECGTEQNPFGKNCADVLDEMTKIAGEYGIEVENHEYYCGSSLMKGSGDTPKRLGLFAHLDVVPLGEGWEYSPLRCTNKDGFLIGRGVGDNKGPAICALYALRFLKEHDIKLKNDVLVYFGLSEETGMQDIQYFCKTQQVPDVSLVTDTNFPICHGEKGLLKVKIETGLDGNLVSFSAGSVANVIPAKAEAVIGGISVTEVKKRMLSLPDQQSLSFTTLEENVKIVASGISKHAAFPDGAVNAVKVLAEALLQAELLSGKDYKAIEAVAKMTEDFYGTGCDIAFSDEVSGALTCAGSIARVEDHKLSLSFDIRYPVTVSGEVVKERFAKRVNALGFSIVHVEDSSPAYVPLEHPVISALCEICDEVLGTHYEPYTMGGGTYSRHLPFAVGYGPGIPDMPNPFGVGHGQGHQPDECIPLKVLLNGLAVYIATIIELDQIL